MTRWLSVNHKCVGRWHCVRCLYQKTVPYCQSLQILLFGFCRLTHWTRSSGKIFLLDCIVHENIRSSYYFKALWSTRYSLGKNDERKLTVRVHQSYNKSSQRTKFWDVHHGRELRDAFLIIIPRFLAVEHWEAGGDKGGHYDSTIVITPTM